MDASIHQGVAFHQQGKLREAEQVYRRLLARNPSDADALHLLGVIATQVRQFEAATNLIGRAIRINAGVAFYHNNLGNALRGMGQIEEAEHCYRRALALDPNYFDGQVNLGTTLREEARFDEARQAYERAVALSPDAAEGHVCLGTILKDQGRIDEALAAYRRGVSLDPSHAAAQGNLLYTMHDSDAVSPAQIFEAHRQWGERIGAPLSRSARLHTNDRSPGRRLRIGYVSADFRDHPVARFLWPLIEHRDRAAFEVACFSSVDKPDEVTARYRSAVDEWHDVVQLGDDALAESIRAKNIDILVDLAGHTNGPRLLTFARKPAPVQITYLGYPDTTGLSAIDVRIVDALTDPPGAETRCVERLERVAGCFLCYAPADLPPVAPTPHAKSGYVTFGSFNSLAKVSTATLRLWKQVLDAVPQSRFILKATRLGDVGTRALAEARIVAAGFPAERVALLGPRATQSQHLQSYELLDIALDTFPYGGTTTTCEALSMGVPVVTLTGEHHASRVGLSLLTAVGRAEWAARSFDDFVSIASRLAADRDLLSSIRARLRDSLVQSPLCDSASFSPRIERIYRQAWERWCRG